MNNCHNHNLPLIIHKLYQVVRRCDVGNYPLLKRMTRGPILVTVDDIQVKRRV